MNLHERWRPDPLSWSSHTRRSRQRRPDGDMRHRDVMVLLHRSCDGPDNACSKNGGFCTIVRQDLLIQPVSHRSGFVAEIQLLVTMLSSRTSLATASGALSHVPG